MARKSNDKHDLVEVEYHDESDATFDLVLPDHRVKFVDGKAMVDNDLAERLRKEGYVK
jgi:hypothetical protein